jgi:hypothetical protein
LVTEIGSLAPGWCSLQAAWMALPHYEYTTQQPPFFFFFNTTTVSAL